MPKLKSTVLENVRRKTYQPSAPHAAIGSTAQQHKDKAVNHKQLKDHGYTAKQLKDKTSQHVLSHMPETQDR